jgi:hypothetical protein
LPCEEGITIEIARQASRLFKSSPLEQLEQGVQHAFKAPTVMGRVLPRKAVRASTWNAILAMLAPIDPRLFSGINTVPVLDSVIAKRAFEKFKGRGGDHGRDKEDWAAARSELISETIGS